MSLLDTFKVRGIPPYEALVQAALQTDLPFKGVKVIPPVLKYEERGSGWRSEVQLGIRCELGENRFKLEFNPRIKMTSSVPVEELERYLEVARNICTLTTYIDSFEGSWTHEDMDAAAQVWRKAWTQ